ncbi:aspartate carbamoyltransferase catalytic subunit [Ructibacterium gallinarum]|uniref:Aspartate carbamoyltransferase n=1 Tax=Ructibacterium gallinarum TaxID=2779355 RepID=A0A9D5R9F5_9FIRM|nr:aspartate carbamoyltransferase catalytic subunit [Ructibacterium gallinarum]MBE5040977.1 aspartate carbamoyltransferase catalytic subunit [Ructibacterium gallinarum]
MKDLLGLKDVSGQEIRRILDEAFRLKKEVLEGSKKDSCLSGKSVITLFYENSTRTRLSFELASKYLGATAANIAASGSSVAKGETLIDTAKTIDRMAADIVIIRHSASGAPHLISRYTKAAVVNAGDGMHEHPTQALLDLMTMQEKKGRIEGLRVAIVGDVKHSRVARSNIYGLHKMGAEVVLAGPSTLMPADLEAMGVKTYCDVDRAVYGADVVMGLRIQLERQKKGLFPTVREYHKFFGIDERRLKLAAPDAIVMHPGPVNRGVELSADVIDGPQSVICDQVTNGVCIRMAVLKMLAER